MSRLTAAQRQSLERIGAKLIASFDDLKRISCPSCKNAGAFGTSYASGHLRLTCYAPIARTDQDERPICHFEHVVAPAINSLPRVFNECPEPLPKRVRKLAPIAAPKKRRRITTR